MAASFTIHVMPLEPIMASRIFWDENNQLHNQPVQGVVDEKVLNLFFSSLLEYKWTLSGSRTDYTKEEYDDANLLVASSPSCWIGDVSWLKAAILENGDKFIPQLVYRVSQLIGDDPVEITDNLISQIAEIFDTSTNSTTYSVQTDKDKIIEFFENNKGLKCFSVSW